MQHIDDGTDRSQKQRVSLFNGATHPTPFGVRDLNGIIQNIKSGTWEKEIAQLRKAESPRQMLLKKKLPAFTPAGLFEHRSNTGLQSETYTGLCAVDLD